MAGQPAGCKSHRSRIRAARGLTNRIGRTNQVRRTVFDLIQRAGRAAARPSPPPGLRLDPAFVRSTICHEDPQGPELEAGRRWRLATAFLPGCRGHHRHAALAGYSGSRP
jgi:hypothetical protein